ncbi:GntR family transcriptional regulator [Asticcacaulis sp. W401b]|uniref:GntR family transcriptional regulator n=1 Tax=Asticcacaulis sp. W401b TaxID=3388666 RepID=UPI003970588D
MRDSVNERVYASVKRAITSGTIVPGIRIDASLLASTLNSSLTPVRMALNRLAGERLVEVHANEGFYMPRVTEPGLRDLYEWNLHLSHTSLRVRPDTPQLKFDLSELRAVAASDIVSATELLFSAIGRLSSNAEMMMAIAACNDRLRAVRHLKNGMIADRESELTELADLLERGDFVSLSKALIPYHKKRKDTVPWLVKRLHDLQ